MEHGNEKRNGRDMKRQIAQYLGSVFAICLVAIGIILLLGSFSVKITDKLNSKYLADYKNDVQGVSSPWYKNGFHIVDESFISELDEIDNSSKNVITIGSSLSMIPFQQQEAELPDGYEYHFLICGNGSWKSDRILYNLIKADSGIKKDDIVKLELSYSTFRNPNTTITESILDKWGKYSVDKDSYEIVSNSRLLLPAYYINEQLIKIQNVWELGYSCIEQLSDETDSYDNRIIPGNFRNNYFNYDSVAASCYIDDDMKSFMKEFIEEINSENKLIIEISPLPEGLCDTEYGSRFDEYVDDELIPFLNDSGIRYFDYRADYANEDYSDGVHLGYEAGVAYTKKMNEDLKNVILNY